MVARANEFQCIGDAVGDVSVGDCCGRELFGTAVGCQRPEGEADDKNDDSTADAAFDVFSPMGFKIMIGFYAKM